MKEKRNFSRTALPQKAKFFGAKGWEDCTITAASRNGLTVTFNTCEKINEGSILHLRVLFSSQPHPVEIKGWLKWIEKKGKYFIGGVGLFRIERNEKKGELLTR